jgi:tetratricopeptide (TPR) repeat protein
MTKIFRPILFALTAMMLAPTGAGAETVAERSALMQRQGAAALMRGKYDKAIQAYDEALGYDKLAPANRANILSDRGVAHWRMNEVELALADFKQAIEINPQYAQVYNNMGNVLMDQNKPQEAIQAYTRAIDNAPTYGVAYNNRASAEFEQGDYKASINDFNAAVRYLTINAVPNNGRGRAYLATKRNYAALRDFSRALKLNGGYGMVYLSRARALAELGEYRDAIKDYSEAISRAREEPQLYFERGQAYQAANDYGPAIADYSRVIDLAPGNAEAYAERGTCYGLARNYDRAFADTDKAVELDPTSVRGFLARAKVLKRKGDPDKALVDLNTALELDKSNAEVLKLIGQIHEVKESKDEAISFYNRSLAADPFMEGSREGLQRLTGTLPPYITSPIGEPVSGWKLAKLASGQYYAASDSYPNLYVRLEMYGEGEPKLLEWVPATGDWKGVGELRYQAGTLEDGSATPLVYSAIIDIKNNKLASIEPFTWGDKQAKWRWGDGTVFVTDPDGMISEVSLRKPSATGRSEEDDLAADASATWSGEVIQPERRSTAASRRSASGGGEPQERARRRPSKSLFDWIFQ